jgi:hypothetical protein
MKTDTRRKLAKESFEEKIRKVSQLIRLVRAVPHPTVKSPPRSTARTSAA